MLDEKRKGGLRGQDKQQGDLRQDQLPNNGNINPE